MKDILNDEFGRSRAPLTATGTDMTNGALLDGKFVGAAAIDPAQHRFLGMFRPADVVPAGNYGLLLCPCGSHLSTNEQIREHWRNGCRDVPQYVTIDEKVNENGTLASAGDRT